MSRGPLDGLLVADFSRVLAGPYCTQMLSDLGAQVIKVERPGVGDDTRSWGPPFVEGFSTYFLSVNRNKRSVALDLASDDGRHDAWLLATRADVLVENFRMGAMDQFGLGYATLRDHNPGLVYCSISAFGYQDPHHLPGYDFLVQAMSGLMSITGQPDGEPTKVGVALVDVLTGMNAAIGVLAALQERARSGKGQRVDTNLMSSALSALVNQASGYLNTSGVPGPMGNQHPSIAPYESLEASDGPIAVAVGNDRQFEALCRALELPWLPDDEHFSTNAARVSNRSALAAHLNERFRTGPCSEWVSALRAAGVPCGPVNDISQAIELAQAVSLDPVVEFSREDGTVARSVASPIELSDSSTSYRLPPPDLDEHGDAIRAWLRDASNQGGQPSG